MIANNLKKIRKENDFTQKQVATRLKIQETTYQAYEQGRAEPNIDIIIQLADIYEVTTDYLLGRSDDIGVVSANANLTEFEDGALALLRKLSKVQQHQVVGYMQALLTA